MRESQEKSRSRTGEGQRMRVHAGILRRAGRDSGAPLADGRRSQSRPAELHPAELPAARAAPTSRGLPSPGRSAAKLGAATTAASSSRLASTHRGLESTPCFSSRTCARIMRQESGSGSGSGWWLRKSTIGRCASAEPALATGWAAAIERWSGDSPRARRPKARQRHEVSFHEKAVGKMLSNPAYSERILLTPSLPPATISKSRDLGADPSHLAPGFRRRLATTLTSRTVGTTPTVRTAGERTWRLYAATTARARGTRGGHVHAC